MASSTSKDPGGRLETFFQPLQRKTATPLTLTPMDVSETAHSSAKRPLDEVGAVGSKRLAKVSDADSPVLAHATPATLHTEATAKRRDQAAMAAPTALTLTDEAPAMAMKR